MNTNLTNLLAQTVKQILRQGVDLLGEIDDRLYTATEENSATCGGAIGGHFRHCIEFISCFLCGVESGRVDYETRARNQRIETEREFAIAEILQTIDALEGLSLPESGNKLLVKPEDFAGSEDFWCASSIERELEFLQSHTIHHYALIAFKLRALGFEVSPEFGIAPSTLRFWKQDGKNKKAKVKRQNV